MFHRCLRLICMTVCVFAAAFAVATPKPTAAGADNDSALLARIRKYHGELKDMSAVLKITNVNDAALSKISSDFAEFVKYGFREFKYSYKSPDMIRMEGSATYLHLLRGISVRHGGTKHFYVPNLGITKSADVTGQANKKETSLDWGLMTGDLWDDYNVWVIRTEVDSGKPVYLLGLRPKNEPHGGTMIVRMDKATLRINERDRYNMEGVVQQRQYFSDYIHPLPHVWIPTIIKLYNNQGQLGGELVYSKSVINSGLPDSLFK